MSLKARRESGIVLVVVLVFALLLASTVATFLRRATVDTLIARNRESAARAEAIARGGIRLATVLLLEDKLTDTGEAAFDTHDELWAQIGAADIPIDDISSLRLRIQDAGDKLNLNAVLRFSETGEGDANALPFLEEFFEKVIEEMPILPAERALYDVSELAASLVDYADPDDSPLPGGAEDDAYQRRNPPQRPANRPLLSLDELRVVEGFDAKLVDALRPYITVYPFAGTRGINPNTAPPHVLALIFFNDGVDFTLADEDVVRQILEVRQDEGILCSGQSDERCTPMSEIVTNSSAIYPPLSYRSDVFTARAEATVAGVRRTIEAVLDRKVGGEPLLLSWRVL